MASKFTVSKGKNGKIYFNLKSANGEIILASQGYASRAGCMKGIASVRANAKNKERFESKTAKNGKFFFVLKAGNGRVIGQSQMYKDGRACTKGLRSVSKSAGAAKVVDG